MSSTVEPSRRHFIEIYVVSLVLLGTILFLFFFNNLDKLLYEPLMTPEEWCASQPCVEVQFLSYTFIIVQPTSTVLVYGLGFLTVGVGLFFLKQNKGQISIQWWGISMLFWGLGALFAGTSYQIFSYELKCSGREYCLWTSWWEISYLLLTVGALNAIMMAQSYSCASGRFRRLLQFYSLINSGIYLIIVVIGTLIPIRFLISFELLVLFLFPITLFFFLLNTVRYLKEKNPMDLRLLITSLSLGIIILLYYTYYLLGITEILWEQGIWFSENDVLHITLIIWILYIGKIVPTYVEDQRNGDID